MKHFKLLVVSILTLLIVFASAQVLEAKEKVVEKSFKAVGNVKIKVVSGDCVVETGKSDEINVVVKYTYSDDDFKPVFKESGNTLVLKEDFLKNNVKHGKSNWKVIVPAKTAVDFKSASGNFKVSGLKDNLEASLASGNVKAAGISGKVDLKTASGNIKGNDIKGDIEVKCASGNIKLENVTGKIEAKTSSGNIKALGVTLTGEGEFKVASGNIVVSLAKSPDHDLKLKAASGSLTLDYNGNELKGSFEIKGMKDNVSVPSNFTEKSSKYSPYGKWYYSNGNSPEIEMKNSSGSIKLKK